MMKHPHLLCVCVQMLYNNYTACPNDTVCPRSSDSFYVVSYYINGSLLLGHTVPATLRFPSNVKLRKIIKETKLIKVKVIRKKEPDKQTNTQSDKADKQINSQKNGQADMYMKKVCNITQ